MNKHEQIFSLLVPCVRFCDNHHVAGVSPALTAVEREMPSGCCCSIEEVDGPVQEVDSRFCVDYLEDLTEEQTQFLCCCLKQYNQQRPSIQSNTR